MAEETANLREDVGAERYRAGRFEEAGRLFEIVATSEPFIEFLTLPGYELLD